MNWKTVVGITVVILVTLIYLNKQTVEGYNEQTGQYCYNCEGKQ